MIDLLAEPSSSNLAWKIVTTVLPTDASSPWGQTLRVFTSSLFALCTVILAYGVVSGVVQSAYTGKALSDRWHQIWTPLRIIVGLGLLIPIPATGYSPAHYLLRDVVARGGINMADAAWGVFVKTVAAGETTILPTSSLGSTVALAILRHEICAAVYNRAGSTWGWEVPVPNGEGSISSGGLPGQSSRVVWSYGPTCGHCSYSLPRGQEAFGASRRDAVADIVSAFRDEAQPYAKLAAETAGLSSADAVTRAVSGKVLSATILRAIREKGAAFDGKITSAAKTAAAQVEKASRASLIDNARLEGFLSAGTYFRALSQISELTTTLANENLEDSPPRTDGDFGQALERAFANRSAGFGGGRSGPAFG